MSETIKNGVARYKLVIFYVCLFSFNSLSTAIVASFLNTEWSSLSSTSKFLLVVVVVQNWTGSMLAFFNKSLARVEQGKSFLETGDTQMITKQTQ